MRPRRLLLAALTALLAVALAWWLARAPDEAPAVGPTDAPARGAAAPAAAASPTPTTTPTATAPRADAGPVDPDAATKGLQLRVRLRGLHAKAPWTALLHLDVDGRDDGANQWFDFDAAARPDDDGLATFALPDWHTTASRQKGRLTARDPSYRQLAHHWEGRLDLTQELVLDVQVVATLAGRVVDEQRRAVVAARITAFAQRDGVPVDVELARTSAGDDGTFRLAVPPDTPLFLLAAPMVGSTGARLVVVDGTRDVGELRHDLLPASLMARAMVGEAAQVGDIVLAAATTVTGRVRWLDGAPIPLATVQALPRDGTTFRLDDRAFVQRHADGRLSPGATLDTGDDGTFTMPAVAGAPLDIGVVRIPDVRLVGALQQAVVPPQPVEFVLPRPVRLRAVNGRDAVPRARVEVEQWDAVAADASGIVALVTLRPLRARASHERLRSPWTDVPADAAGTVVDLVMTSARTELAVEFTGDFRVRNTVITWRSDDGREGREHLLRDDRSGPFQLFLEPGRYHVTAGPGGGERNGHFLLPVERDVDLAGGPQTLTLPAVFGGTFTVMVTDSSGVWVGGACQLRNRDGTDVTERFRVQDGGPAASGLPGELLPDGVNHFTRILPPGDYELMCDFRDHGAHRQRFTIRPREVTEVRIRLP